MSRVAGGALVGAVFVAGALREAGHVVLVHDDEFEPDARDVDWLQAVGQRGWVVLTKDARIRTIIRAACWTTLSSTEGMPSGRVWPSPFGDVPAPHRLDDTCRDGRGLGGRASGRPDSHRPRATSPHRRQGPPACQGGGTRPEEVALGSLSDSLQGRERQGE